MVNIGGLGQVGFGKEGVSKKTGGEDKGFKDLLMKKAGLEDRKSDGIKSKDETMKPIGNFKMTEISNNKLNEKLKPFTIEQLTKDSIAFSKEAVNKSVEVEYFCQKTFTDKMLLGPNYLNEMLGKAKQALKAIELAEENLILAKKLPLEQANVSMYEAIETNKMISSAEKELEMAMMHKDFLNLFLINYKK